MQTTESEGQMLQRVMPELMGMRRILAINDEAHHCYRRRPEEADDEGKPRRRRPQRSQAKRRSRADVDFRA